MNCLDTAEAGEFGSMDVKIEPERDNPWVISYATLPRTVKITKRVLYIRYCHLTLAKIDKNKKKSSTYGVANLPIPTGIRID